jgi:hypothetical protein
MQVVHYKTMKRLLIAFLLLSLAGCANMPLISNLLGSSSQSATQISQLFFDDFSETKSGWDRFSGEIGFTDYKAETYQMFVNEPNTDLFANPDQLYKDVVVEVNATRISGPANNNFGVICRYRDEKNFYSAQISSDGYAGIFRMKDGVLKLLGNESMIPVPAILGGTAENRIRFECIGSSLILAVNGTPVDVREDKSFDKGDVGLIAGTYEESGTLVAFDNFRVSQP